MSKPDFNNVGHVMDWVLEQCDWPPLVKLCYLALYYRCFKESARDMGIRDLGKQLGTTPKVVLAAIRNLKALGAVTVTRRKGDRHHPNPPNEYRVTPPWETMQYMERPPRGWWARSEKRGDGGESDACSCV